MKQKGVIGTAHQTKSDSYVTFPDQPLPRKTIWEAHGKQGGSMAQIYWREGTPPDSHRDRRLLLIARSRCGTHDAQADGRPGLYVGHYNSSRDAFVPEIGSGMNANAPPPD